MKVARRTLKYTLVPLVTCPRKYAFEHYLLCTVPGIPTRIEFFDRPRQVWQTSRLELGDTNISESFFGLSSWRTQFKRLECIWGIIMAERLFLSSRQTLGSSSNKNHWKIHWCWMFQSNFHWSCMRLISLECWFWISADHPRFSTSLSVANLLNQIQLQGWNSESHVPTALPLYVVKAVSSESSGRWSCLPAVYESVDECIRISISLCSNIWWGLCCEAWASRLKYYWRAKLELQG